MQGATIKIRFQTSFWILLFLNHAIRFYFLCPLFLMRDFSWFTPIKAPPLFVSLQCSQMSTVSLIMCFLRLCGLAINIKDMPVVGYEHLWLLQSHVTCMLSDECLNRIPGLLNVNVCIETTANFKERDTKTDKKKGIHGRPQTPACGIVLDGKLRNVWQKRHFRRLRIGRSRQ
jgi:hypothetical protein